MNPPEEEEFEAELIDFDELLALADIDEDDIEAAIIWWDAHASDEFKGALESGS